MQYILADPALVQKYRATVYCVQQLFFLLPDKHVVLGGELSMPDCGLCMTAYKKAALLVKSVCLHKSFSKLHPFLSQSVLQSLCPSVNLSELWIFHVVCGKILALSVIA